MWERLGYAEIDPSVLSRVVSGERLFSRKQLLIFCGILNISKNNSTLLQEKLYFDLSNRIGVGVDLFESAYRHSIKYAELVLDASARLRKQSNSEMAIYLSKANIDLLNSFNKSNPYTPKSKFLYLLAQSYLEFSRNTIVFEIYDEAKKNVFMATNILRKLSSQIKNRNLMSSSYSLESSMHYVLGDYSNAIEKSLKSLNYISDPILEINPLRMLLISSSCLGQKNLFNFALKKLRMILNDCDVSTRLMILFSISKAHVMMSEYARAEKYLLLSWDELAIMEKEKHGLHDLRYIQIAKTQLQFTQKSKDSNLVNSCVEISDRAIDLADRLKFVRYASEIKKLKNDIFKYVSS